MQLDDILAGYIEAVYFTETGDIDQPDAGTPLSDSARNQASAECQDFLSRCEAAGLLASYTEAGGTWTQFGRDFWLTRNGHGVGFWDRGLGEVGEKLSDIAQSLGDRYAYEADGFLTFS